MSDIVKNAARMMNILPDEDQNFAYEFIEKLVLAWDPDYTKLTAEVAVLHEVAEKGEFVDSKDIDWNQIGNSRNNRQVVRPVGLRFYE